MRQIVFRATGDRPLGETFGVTVPSLPGGVYRSLRFIVAAVWTVSWLASCSLAAPTAPAGTGVRGVVTLGPTCPVAQEAQPCVTPMAATLVVTSAEDGSVVARVTSDDDGTFSVDVPPGEYVILPEPGGDPFPVGRPVEVTVEAGAYAEVEVAYDTGIR